MNNGQLNALAVPWMISPSTSDIQICLIENKDARAVVEIAQPPTDEEARSSSPHAVELVFFDGQWMRTYPAASDLEPIPEGYFDTTALPFQQVQSAEEWLVDFQAEWQRTGLCPDPRIYEVTYSRWLAETGADRFGCKHFVIVGHDLWFEILSTRFEWKWV